MRAGTTDPVGARGEKGRQTRQSILDAAIERFGLEGFRATSLADIARDSGVGGSVPYAYFASKEALFLAALDEDAAAVIREGVTTLLETPGNDSWRQPLILSLIGAVENHPLAKRILAGLEPNVTDRVMELPALADLQVAVADRLRSDQQIGLVRSDIDPDTIARGGVTIFLALLMSVVQFGTDMVAPRGPDVLALLDAAIDPVGQSDDPVNQSDTTD